MQLMKQPLCEECQKYGKIVPATDVHHIVAKRDGGEDSEENFQSLCHSCHSKKTAVGE